MTRGKFITFEGVDGAGKSSHIEWMAGQIRARGHDLVVTREPGGTPLGEKLRALLLAEPMHLETETLLMFAARREHLEQVILPAINRGQWVLSDRFTDASYAYQGGGRGLEAARIRILEDWVQQGFQPDLTLVFDLPVEVARQRLNGTGMAMDRFENEGAAFFNRVREAYLKRAEESRNRIKVIDSTQSFDDIQVILKKMLVII